VIDRAAPLGAGGLCLIGTSSTVVIGCMTGTGTGTVTGFGKLPALLFPNDVSGARIQGIEFANDSHGWAIVSQNTATPTPRQSHVRTMVWATTNAGRTWATIYETPLGHL
jgi:hypothetical protein